MIQDLEDNQNFDMMMRAEILIDSMCRLSLQERVRLMGWLAAMISRTYGVDSATCNKIGDWVEEFMLANICAESKGVKAEIFGETESN